MPDIVTWLVATGRLELKIATVRGAPGSFLYHEKIGLFEDDSDNAVAYTGSANETYAALCRNFEVIDVYRSWMKEESTRALGKRRDFDALWSGDTQGLEIMSFAEAARRGCLHTRPGKQQPDRWGEKEDDGETVPIGKLEGLEETLNIPSEITLRGYQVEAVRAWLRNEGKGILNMATGSGKTIIALSAACKLYEQVSAPLLLLVVCPYLHLVHQWAEVARLFGLNPVLCAEGHEKWQANAQLSVFNCASGVRRISSLITTNASFRSKAMLALLRSVPVPVMVVGDEVHNLGAPGVRDALPSEADYRLGLSATPDRAYDEEGTEHIAEFFGEEVYNYSLEAALRDGVLCPYMYYPHRVELEEDEFEEYLEITSRIGRALGAEEEIDRPSDRVKALLFKRARMVAVARNKIDVLRKLVALQKIKTHTLVYCGDGSVEGRGGAAVLRQVDAVVALLGRELGRRVGKYLAETPLGRRAELRRGIVSGSIEYLVAIRCLDEGVDIPEIRTAYILASSSVARQFIQRRGRLLRKSNGKDSATIHDFIAVPPDSAWGDGSAYSVMRALVGRELRRAWEFAKLAVNGPEAAGSLLELRKRFGLLGNWGCEHEC
jgi:superfamily II DNA or RNA helicase